jgi:hypothetical protein
MGLEVRGAALRALRSAPLEAHKESDQMPDRAGMERFYNYSPPFTGPIVGAASGLYYSIDLRF